MYLYMRVITYITHLFLCCVCLVITLYSCGITVFLCLMHMLKNCNVIIINQSESGSCSPCTTCHNNMEYHKQQDLPQTVRNHRSDLVRANGYNSILYRSKRMVIIIIIINSNYDVMNVYMNPT